jgi:hypothetical protein
MISSTSIIFTMLLLVVSITSVQSRRADRTYSIKKDRIMSDHRLAEFSIYSSGEKERKYRIRTYYSSTHAALLYAAPSGEIVGMFEGDWTKEIIKADISILNTRSNQWIDGTITKRTDAAKKYAISWNGTNIIMAAKFLSSTKELRDEIQGDLLAEFRPSSGVFVSPPTSYKLKVKSDKVPDAVHFFAVAVMDHKNMISAA